MPHSTKQSVLFPAIVSKRYEIAFDEPQVTSDGGALLLKAVDDQIGLTGRLATALTDPREPGKIRHTLADMLRQRIFGICCGYGDANDTARLNTDPMHKLLLDRDPVQGDDLASQPTLSRFENRRRPVSQIRKYLADIGRRGGLRSRRTLDPEQARAMVRVREARRAYRRFHARCFWSSPPDLHIGADDVAWVADQLMQHGGREAWLKGAQLSR